MILLNILVVFDNAINMNSFDLSSDFQLFQSSLQAFEDRSEYSNPN